MKIYKNLRVLYKKAVKLDREYTKTNPKCRIRLNRILKQALSVERKLVSAARALNPIAGTKELRDIIHKWLSWAEMCLNNRIGRIVRNPIPRTTRRKL